MTQLYAATIGDKNGKAQILIKILLLDDNCEEKFKEYGQAVLIALSSTREIGAFIEMISISRLKGSFYKCISKILRSLSWISSRHDYIIIHILDDSEVKEFEKLSFPVVDAL